MDNGFCDSNIMRHRSILWGYSSLVTFSFCGCGYVVIQASLPARTWELIFQWVFWLSGEDLISPLPLLLGLDKVEVEGVLEEKSLPLGKAGGLAPPGLAVWWWPEENNRRYYMRKMTKAWSYPPVSNPSKGKEYHHSSTSVSLLLGAQLFVYRLVWVM